MMNYSFTTVTTTFTETTTIFCAKQSLSAFDLSNHHHVRKNSKSKTNDNFVEINKSIWICKPNKRYRFDM